MFGFHPVLHGFWQIKWDTPDGIRKFKMIMKRNKWFYNEEDVEGCVYGLGKSGEYKLTTSYLDYFPILNNNNLPWPYAESVSFIGMDVELP